MQNKTYEHKCVCRSAFNWCDVLTGKWKVKLDSIFISPLGSADTAQVAQLSSDHCIRHCNFLQCRICSWDNYVQVSWKILCAEQMQSATIIIIIYYIGKPGTFYEDCVDKGVRKKKNRHHTRHGSDDGTVIFLNPKDRCLTGRPNEYLTFGLFKSKSNRPRTFTTLSEKSW